MVIVTGWKIRCLIVCWDSPTGILYLLQRVALFFNPFQSAPSDFYDPEFLHARTELIQQRKQQLKQTSVFNDIVWQHFHTKYGLRSPLVNWDALTKDLLSQALQRIPIEHWLAVFERILVDRHHNRTGLPDLIHFPTTGGYRLIEVKGPGDKLQKNQLRWLQYFDLHKIPCSVAYVTWNNSLSHTKTLSV